MTRAGASTRTASDCDTALGAADVHALLACALIRHRRGDLPGAEQCYRHVLTLNPAHFDALHMLGAIALQTGQPERAIELISSALLHGPRNPSAHRNLALAHLRLKDPAAAVISYARAAALQPEAMDTHLHLADVLMELGRPDEALQAADRAIQLQPESAVAHLTRAVCLRSLQRPEDALASCTEAVRVQPSLAEAWDKRAAALQDLNRHDEALVNYEAAIGRRPDCAAAYAHAGLLHLRRGNYDVGWRLSEWRLKPGGGVPMCSFSKPRWSGENVPAGFRLLVPSEQGLGDTIQFSRYLPLLATMHRVHVLLVAPRSLTALMRSLHPRVTVIEEGNELPEFDAYCPLMSLPFALRKTLDGIPAPISYLHPDDNRVRRWKKHLGHHGFKVGISWQGSQTAAGVGRSIPLALFERIAGIDGVRLISLQKNQGVEQLRLLPAGMIVEDLGPEFDAGPDGFADAAAVMATLDLVITVDTSIGHLAGALGRPTWVALKHVADWRWLEARDDSPWYPRHRLFRQPQRGDWQTVLARMHSALEAVASGSRKTPNRP